MDKPKICVECKHCSGVQYVNLNKISNGYTTTFVSKPTCNHPKTVNINLVTGVKTSLICSELRNSYCNKCGYEGHLFEPKDKQ